MKERLTGAIILVALIVLLVPELLTGPLTHGPAAAMTVPAPSLRGSPIQSPGAAGALRGDSSAASSSSPSEPPIRSYTLPLTGSPPAHLDAGAQSAGSPGARGAVTGAAAAAQRAGASPAANAGSAPAAPGSRGSAQGRGEKDGSPGSRPAREAQPPKASGAVSTGASASVARASPRAAVRRGPQRPVSGGWVVQLGYFSIHSNALRLAHRLRVKGFRVSVSPSRVRGRLLWRVWSGPVRSRAAAMHLARRLRLVGLRGEVLQG